MATDPDDIATVPVAQHDPEGREYLTFERRRWIGSPRTRRWDLDLHRLDEDGTSRCIRVPMLAMFMTEVEEEVVDGVTMKLEPGMSGVVEIRTGEQRISDYLFSPLVRYHDEALRER